MRRFCASGPAPDLHLAIEDIIAEGDKVVVRFTWSHTHTVPSLGMAPTGKPISWTGISINRLSDGKIVEEWANFDELGRPAARQDRVSGGKYVARAEQSHHPPQP